MYVDALASWSVDAWHHCIVTSYVAREVTAAGLEPTPLRTGAEALDQSAKLSRMMVHARACIKKTERSAWQAPEKAQKH